MDYGKIISESIDILKNKTILFWAFVSTILGGGSLNFEIGDFNSPSTEFSGMMGETGAIILIIVFMLGFVLVLIALNIYFGNIARASLIAVTHKRVKKPKTEVTIEESYEWGKEKWFKLFLMRVILAAPYVALIAGIMILTFFGITMFEDSAPESLTIILLFCCGLIIILVPIMFILSVLNTFGERSLVLKSLEPIEALKDGWRFFVNNLKDLLISFFIAFGITLIMSIPLVILISIISLPFGVILFGLIAVNNIYISIIVGLIISILLWIINSVIMTPLNAFVSVYWTKIYMDLNKL